MVAKQFYKERMILCGDSAHICSPLGGQGMNCGWLGAKHLSEAFDKIFKIDLYKLNTRIFQKVAI
jgi:2-polyprenyl-6-methoxyphenol hydroxylase-like FAD-dependent oxidoreductase